MSTKQRVIHAASTLFFQKGFDGTSVRDIAYKADVNVSLISYYFKGKQGLLEHAVIHYYESYLEMMEENIHAYQKESTLDRSEEHTSELQSRFDLVCRLLLEKKKNIHNQNNYE